LNYNVYSNGGSGPIDYTTIVATTSGLTFETAALAHPGDWRFAVRADDGAYEETNLDASVRLALDAAGADVTDLPTAPLGLSAWPIAGGKIRATWTYSTLKPITGFHVYVGTTTPDYGTVAATVAYSPALRSFQADLSGLADATAYAIGVRAYDAAGEEANTTTATATTKATGPDAVVGLSASTDPADW